MNVNISIKGVTTVAKALTYAFPKKGNAPITQKFTVNGKEAETAQTGGGKYPTYIYFKHEGASYYLPKNVTPDNLSNIEVIAEVPKATPVAPAPEAAVTANTVTKATKGRK